jgi:hypothetical protein
MIVVELGTDPPSGQYSLMSPYGRNKTSHDDTMTGYYIVRNGSSVTVHDHMEFLQRANKKYRKWTVIWKNVWDNGHSLFGTPYLTPQNEEACDVKWLCVDKCIMYLSIRMRRSAAPSYLFAVTHTGADCWYAVAKIRTWCWRSAIHI